MSWLIFAVSAIVIVLAAMQLARFGDIIAVRTRLGGMFIGLLLLAGATSLPEVLTSINSLALNTPDLAAGNLLGSNTFNMLILAMLDLVRRNERILRKAALKHALSGSLTTFLIGLVVFFLLADIPLMIGWVGVDSLIIIGVYVFAMRLIQSNSPPAANPEHVEMPEKMPPLWQGILGFLAAAGVLVAATPFLVQASADIAVITGLGNTFIGSTLVAVVTSLPEMVTTLAAVKLGADDMAIGNLFGSNMFNMFAIGLTDVFYTQGRFFAVMDPSFLLVGTLGLLMTALALIGNLARLEKRILFVELDALALMIMYVLGTWLLYTRG